MIVYTMLILISIMMISFAIMRLVLPKFKIAREAVYSAVAVYSADSASEWCLYNHYVINNPSTLEQPGAVFYGAFDDGFGTTASDLSGNDNNLTLANGPTWVTGRFNSGLNFDGTVLPYDYAYCSDADCGGAGGLDIDLNTDFTVSAWVNPAYFGASPIVIASKLDPNTGGLGWALSLNSNGHINFLLRTSGGSYTSADDGISVPAGTWSHVAATVDRDGTVVRYFNGLPTGASGGISYMNGQTADNTRAFCVGGIDQGGNVCTLWRFNGRIDDVRVFERPLTPAEIQDMVPVPTVPLVMENASTYQIYYPASSATVSSCLEGSIDYRMVGTFDGISRSLQLSQ